MSKRLIILAFGLLLALGASSSFSAARHDQEEKPLWISSPKQSDGMYLYAVGYASGKDSDSDAREAAMDDARRKLSRQVRNEAGIGDSSDALLPLRRVEIVPDCVYVEETPKGFNGWVQVSYPVAEKQATVERLQRPAPADGTAGRPSPPGSPGSSAGSDNTDKLIGPEGGEVENRELGVTVTIPPGAIKTATLITIRRAENPPRLAGTPIPATLKSMFYLGPVLDLGPSGTRFDQPVNVRIKCPELAGLDPSQFEPEAGWYDGARWQALDTVEFKNGELSFNTDHFTYFWGVVTLMAAGASLLAWYQSDQGLDTWKDPWTLINPDRMSTSHLGKINLPGQLEFPLALPRYGFKTFIPVPRPAILPRDGATMVNRRKANCWDCCNYVATVLLAKNDTRFEGLKVVQGLVSVTGPDGKLKSGDHAWLEVKVGGKVYALDTTFPNDLVFISLDEAYRRNNLKPIARAGFAAIFSCSSMGIRRPGQPEQLFQGNGR